jgi:hypothetical protein
MGPPDTIGIVEEVLECAADEYPGSDGEEHAHDALRLRRPREDDRQSEEQEYKCALPIECGTGGKSKEQVVRGVQEIEDQLDPVEMRSVRKHCKQRDAEQNDERMDEGPIEEHRDSLSR